MYDSKTTAHRWFVTYRRLAFTCSADNKNNTSQMSFWDEWLQMRHELVFKCYTIEHENLFFWKHSKITWHFSVGSFPMCVCVCVELIELLSWNRELNLNLDDRQVVAWKIQSLDHDNYWNIFQIKNVSFRQWPHVPPSFRSVRSVLQTKISRCTTLAYLIESTKVVHTDLVFLFLCIWYLSSNIWL